MYRLKKRYGTISFEDYIKNVENISNGKLDSEELSHAKNIVKLYCRQNRGDVKIRIV